MNVPYRCWCVERWIAALLVCWYAVEIASDSIPLFTPFQQQQCSNTTTQFLGQASSSTREQTWVVCVAPVLRRGETMEQRQLIDEALERHWRSTAAVQSPGGISNPYVRDKGEGGAEYTYGELTPLGVRQLIELMELEPLQDSDDDAVVFYDLGSGTGKIVVQMHLENVVHRATGIELSRSRSELAIRAWESVRGDSQLLAATAAVGKSVHFRQGDILKADFTDATHLFACSLCFPPAVEEQLARIIMDNSKAHGKLRLVAALSDLALLEEENTDDKDTSGNTIRWTKETRLVQTTWGSATVRLYKRVQNS